MPTELTPGATPVAGAPSTSGGQPAAPTVTSSAPPTPAAPPPAATPTPGAGTTAAPTPVAAATPAPGPTPAAPDVAEYQRQIAEYQAQIQRYLPLAQLGYQQYQRQQQQPQPAGPPARKSPFGVPEFDHGLLKFLRRGPDGQVVADPAAPPDAAARYQAYADAVQGAQQKFWHDPMQFLGDPVRELIREEAGRLFQQQYAQAQAQQRVQQIIGQSAEWLYERDQQGQARWAFDPVSGRQEPVLTPVGRMYKGLVERAAQMGVADVQHQHDFAVAMIQNAAYQARGQQAAAPAAAQQQGEAAKAAFLQQAAAAPPAAPQPPVTAPPPAATVSLRQKLLADLRGNGITDQVLQDQLSAGAA